MSYWNYRVIRCLEDYNQEEYFAIAEVYYDDEQKIVSYTDPLNTHPMGETAAELGGDLIQMLQAFAMPVIDYGDLPVESEEDGEEPVP